MREERKLTSEQEAIRLRGLRVLARIIVRAHLSSLMVKDAGKNGRVGTSTADISTHEKEDEGAA